MLWREWDISAQVTREETSDGHVVYESVVTIERLNELRNVLLQCYF